MAAGYQGGGFTPRTGWRNRTPIFRHTGARAAWTRMIGRGKRKNASCPLLKPLTGLLKPDGHSPLAFAHGKGQEFIQPVDDRGLVTHAQTKIGARGYMHVIDVEELTAHDEG